MARRLGWHYGRGADVLPALAAEGDTWHEVSGGTLPYPLLVRFGRDEQDRLIVTGLLIAPDSGEVSTTSLRRLPLGQVVAQLGQRLHRKPRDEFDAAIQDAVRLVTAEKAPQVQRRPREGREGDLRRFAAAYRRALDEHPRRPVQAAADRLNISRATAHRWLALARERGLLPTGGTS